MITGNPRTPNPPSFGDNYGCPARRRRYKVNADPARELANGKGGRQIGVSSLGRRQSAALVIIPRKSPASAVVTELQAPRRRGKPGRITIKAETVSLLNHETATLRGLRTMQSGNQNVTMERTTEISDLILGTGGFGVVFLPLFMLGHGEYPVLPVGMEFLPRSANRSPCSVQNSSRSNPWRKNVAATPSLPSTTSQTHR